MRFTGTYTGIKFDFPKYRQQLEDGLIKSLHHAAKAWLQVVAGRGGRVPLWSGMARASLLELSELIDGTVILSPLKAKSRISYGRHLGTAIQEITPTSVKLIIETNVPHYTLQEYRNVGVSPRAPWQSLQAGRLAFQFATEGIRLPKPIFQALKMKV